MSISLQINRGKLVADIMNTSGLKANAQIALAVIFLFLVVGFLFNLWGSYQPPPSLPPTPPVYTNPATVRFSLAELKQQEADTSGADCYVCHEEGAAKELPRDEQGNIVLPKAHRDLVFYRMNCEACHSPEEEVEVVYDDDFNVILPEAHKNAVLRHGANARNNNCYNCHVATNLTVLRTRSGEEFPLTESTQVCGGCHGPTLRDWEAGIHGRWNGYWLTSAGARERKGCASCHDPHAPGFPHMIPGPPPSRYMEATSEARAHSSPATEHASETE